MFLSMKHSQISDAQLTRCPERTQRVCVNKASTNLTTERLKCRICLQLCNLIHIPFAAAIVLYPCCTRQSKIMKNSYCII